MNLNKSIVLEGLRNPDLAWRMLVRRPFLSGRMLEFLVELTGETEESIESYLREVSSSTIERTLRSDLAPYPRMGSATSNHGRILYALCRSLKPHTLVETGVFSGISSAYILYAIQKNGLGHLDSIGLPDPFLSTYGKEPGFAVPDELRERWTLQLGSSSELLEPLLDKLGSIDFFFHDSLHTYANMMFEFSISWKYLRQGGLVISDNIDDNKAFRDFSAKTLVRASTLKYLISDYGALRKS
jgi:predicted O-methyltransferase YrrM